MYAIEGSLSGEARAAVRRLWLELVEPFFGLPARWGHGKEAPSVLKGKPHVHT